VISRAFVAALVALAACSDPPPLSIKYALKTEGTQVCYANLTAGTIAQSCSDVSMLCQSVLDVRVVSASDTTKQYVKLCQVVTGRPNLCSIAGIDLPTMGTSIPEQTLEVDVAVYRDDDLPHDDATGDPICPPDLAFGADGLPVSSSPSPAVGGRAFYHPGDTTTVVELGCTDEAAIQDPKCAGVNTVDVTATVSDFDSDVSVSSTLADTLSVGVGEPKFVMTGYSISQQVHALDRAVVGPIPSWRAAVDFQPQSSACIEVLEDIPEATASLACKQVAPDATQLDLNGVRLAKPMLDRVLAALGATQFPPEGLVVGIVLDQVGNPAANVDVFASDLSAVGMLGPDGRLYAGPTTLDTGVFISTAAAYGTTFTAKGSGPSEPTGFGGRVEGKVTVVVLQFSQSTTP
jgi:hypothetical protein